MHSASQVLLIAHPGHEVRAHHWLETVKPRVFVLTDGSGGGGTSRLDGTREILEKCGAREGKIFGRFSDREFYAIIQAGKTEELLKLAQDLYAEWEHLGVTSVTADMCEGYNTTHDLCRCLAGAVIEKLHRKTGREIENWDFPLEGLPDRMVESTPAENLKILILDPEAFERKLAAAEHYEQLKMEVDRAVQTLGQAAFLREVYRRAPQPPGLEWTEEQPPFYETYGARMVASGRYAEVITFREHIQPLALALWEWATEA